MQDMYCLCIEAYVLIYTKTKDTELYSFSIGGGGGYNQIL